MDSLGIFRGYCKVERNIENSQPNPNFSLIHAQKRSVTIITVSFALVLTLILCLLVVALINESNSESEFFESSSSAIKAVCSVTRHPDSCFSSLSSANAPAADPELIFLLSLRVAANELSKLSSLRGKLKSQDQVNGTGSEPALGDCWELFEEAVSGLKDSVSAMVMEGEKLLTEKKIGDMKTWISGAMTDQETCLDGLEEARSTAIDEVKVAVHKSGEYTSNSLAILANMDALLHKFNLNLH